MAAFTIRKAEKHLRKLRLALTGQSKSGKTFTSLLFARALAGPDGQVGVIDTEGGNSEIYAGSDGVGEFALAVLSDNNPRTYIDALDALIKAGCLVVVIDSLSHAWIGRGGVLQIVDEAGQNAKNKWTSGWGAGTPLHNDLIATINSAPVHIIATMRQKVEYAMETNAAGKQVPKKVGMAAVQREGMEYEFDITGEMDDTAMTITGIRGLEFEPFKGKTIKKPDAGFIQKIKGLLSDAPPPAPTTPQTTGAVSPRDRFLNAVERWWGHPRADKAGFTAACGLVANELGLPGKDQMQASDYTRAALEIETCIADHIAFPGTTKPVFDLAGNPTT